MNGNQARFKEKNRFITLMKRKPSSILREKPLHRPYETETKLDSKRKAASSPL
jgi:hypothetical protein